MNLNDAFACIYATALNDSGIGNQFLSDELMFKGYTENKKTQIVKNQHLQDYQMYKGKLAWEMNQNAEHMFNGHNQQLVDNQFKSTEFRDQRDLSPSFYSGHYAHPADNPQKILNREHGPTSTLNQNNGVGNGLFKQKKTERELDRQNSSIQNYYFSSPLGNGARGFNKDF